MKLRTFAAIVLLPTLGALILLLVTLLPFLFPPEGQTIFRERLSTIRAGMTVDEVEKIMGQYSKGLGKGVPGGVEEYPTGESRLTATGTMYYRWNTSDGRYDWDLGEVTFKDGKVTTVEFLPD